MGQTIAQVAEAMQAKVLAASAVTASCGPDMTAREIEELLTDSRYLRRADVCLFVALKTAKNDGHRYIPELYAKGVRAFLVSVLPEHAESVFPEAVFLQVPDTLGALQALAGAYRRQFRIPVVGITGSNGKTIVKEWLAGLLAPGMRVVKSPKSYNSQIGVPLSLWEIRPWHEIGLFEAGVSKPGEMAALAGMIRPTVGILTNIRAAHAANFRDNAQKAAEKLRLFHGAEKLIYCADDAVITAAIDADAALQSVRRLAWSGRMEAVSDQAGRQMVLRLTGREEIVRGGCRFMRLTAVYQPSAETAVLRQIEIPFTDTASLENVMPCWLFLLDLGVPEADIAARMAQLEPVEMRMELKEGINRNYLINDVYNSDYDAFAMAVDHLQHQAQGRRKRVILSDILQSGQPEARLYTAVADLLRRHHVEALVGIGPQMMRYQALFEADTGPVDTALGTVGNAAGAHARPPLETTGATIAVAPMETAFYPDTEAFLQTFDPQAWHDEAILLKGARPFAFERIVQRLQKKVHETVMEIDLDAMIHNLNFFRLRLKPQTKVMIMAKAFSYGSGSYEVANALAFHHSDYITVAYADEGITLRKKGIELPIMVVNAESDGLAAVLQYRLEPEIYSFRMLDLLREQLRTLPETASVSIHIKLDTGMHRLGFEAADLPRLMAVLTEEPRLHVRSIFTHLATADDPDMDVYTRAQLERFDRMSGVLKAGLPYGDTVLRHALNTAGICRFPEYQYDMVRLGIGLYGVGVTAEMEGQLETVSTFKTTIAQIRTIAAGEAVGYGRRFIAEKPMRIGVICVGYADGLNRRLSQGVGRVWIKGKIAPIIGNICMDMSMLDLTDVDAAEGDDVILFGKDWPVTRMADALGTIPYEVLTGISPRVKRIYYQA